MRTTLALFALTMIFAPALGCAAARPGGPSMTQSPSQKKLEKADRTFGGRKYKEALQDYKGALAAAEREGSAQVRVEALSQIARCHSILGELDQGELWLAKAAPLATPDEPLGWSRYLGVRGIFERERGDKESAKATFGEMYRYCVDRELFRRAVDAAHHIAIVAPPEEQIEWAMRGIEAAERLGDEGWLAVLWNNLGVTYEDLKRYNDAVAAYLQARDYHYRAGSDFSKMAADWAVGHAYRLAGDFPQAMNWLPKTLRWAERRYAVEPGPSTAEWIGYCEEDLGEALIGLGKRQEGLEHLRRALKKQTEGGLADHWPEHVDALKKRISELERRPAGSH